MLVRKHRCVRNHVGSAKLMECKSGVERSKELSHKGTPVEVVEGTPVKLWKAMKKLRYVLCYPISNRLELDIKETA